MKKLLRLTAWILLIAMTAGTVFAQSAETGGKYDPVYEGIVSSYYQIDRDRGYILGVAPGTTAEQLKNVCIPGNLTVSQDVVGTGTTVTVTVEIPQPEPTIPETTVPETTVSETTVPETTVSETTVPEITVSETTVSETTVPETTESEVQPAVFSLRMAPAPETVTHTLTVIVTGDLNGDANVSISDMLMIKSSVLGESLSSAAAAAGDLNGDGGVTITDFLKIKSYLLGLEGISAGSGHSQTGDPILLMTPESSQSWGITATAYASGDETIASVDAHGTVTTHAALGSAFIYALDESGNVIARTIVTVLNEKLAVSLPQSAALIKGQSTTLFPVFNHPVQAPIHWSTSDAGIVTVDGNGTITGQNFGSAVVTASLANGSTAQVTVHVAPPITAMYFGKPLYKVKPGSTIPLPLGVEPADSGEEILYSSSDSNIAVVNADGSVTGVSYGTVTITATGRFSGKTATCQVKICDLKQVALTFDDGPSTHTIRLLNFLAEKDVKVTFFMVGNRIGKYPNTVKKMAADGHELGYHSYAHQQQPGLTTKQIVDDYNYSNNILTDLTGRGFTVWRTPGGAFNDRVLLAVPLPHIYWSVDTWDWKYRDVTYVRDAILTKSKDGSIVLLHDLHGTTVDGAIQAIEQMLAGDYEFLTVTEILSRDGTPPEPSKNYYNG